MARWKADAIRIDVNHKEAYVAFMERRVAASAVATLNDPGGKQLDTVTAAPRNDPVMGIVWVTLAMALFAGLAASSRYAISLGYNPLQIAFFRFLTALILMLPLLAWRGMSLLRSNAPNLYAVRAVISLFSMTAWFYAISLIPLGELKPSAFCRRCSARWPRSSSSAKRFGCAAGQR